MSKKYYYESVGEIVSQVYEIEGAKDFEEAKKLAFFDMEKGDVIAECDSSKNCIVAEGGRGEYHRLIETECEQYAKLVQGAYLPTDKEDCHEEIWKEEVWSWSDEPEEIYDSEYKKIEGEVKTVTLDELKLLVSQQEKNSVEIDKQKGKDIER